MMFFPAFTEICCLIPCPIAFIVFAILPLSFVRRRQQARRAALINFRDQLDQEAAYENKN